MALNRWRKLSEEIRASNRWWTYKRDEFELPSRKRGEYHYVSTHGSAMVVPERDDGRILLVRQYRYLNDRFSLEFPGGGVPAEGRHEETARRELAEETGCACSRLAGVGEFNPYNGVTNEICRVFAASGLSSIPATPDPTEEFEVVALLPGEIDAFIADGAIWDGMTLAAWTLYRAWGK